MKTLGFSILLVHIYSATSSQVCGDITFLSFPISDFLEQFWPFITIFHLDTEAVLPFLFGK